MSFGSDVVNRAAAMVACGAVTRREVWKCFDDPHQLSISGEEMDRLLHLTARISIRIALLGSQMQTAYRSEYRKICERVPVNGKED